MEVFIIAAIVGFFIGIFSGLLGIGGGTIMIPIFRLGFGMEAIASTATSMFTIIPTSIGGFITHIKNKTCIPKLGLAAGLAGACTSPVGVYLASISPSWAIMFAAACIIGYSAISMFVKAVRMPKVDKTAKKLARRKAAVSAAQATAVSGTAAAQATADAAPAEPKPEIPHLTGKQLAQGGLIGLVAGLASGYVGVGGGFLMVPLFVSVLGVMMKQASGTSLVAVTLLAIPGAIEQALLGNIHFTAGIAIAIGSIPGAVVGASLIRYVPERALRLLFGVFLFFSAVILAVNEFAPFFG